MKVIRDHIIQVPMPWRILPSSLSSFRIRSIGQSEIGEHVSSLAVLVDTLDFLPNFHTSAFSRVRALRGSGTWTLVAEFAAEGIVFGFVGNLELLFRTACFEVVFIGTGEAFALNDFIISFVSFILSCSLCLFRFTLVSV